MGRDRKGGRGGDKTRENLGIIINLLFGNFNTKFSSVCSVNFNKNTLCENYSNV